MNQSLFHSEDNNICEAIDCFEKSTTEITVKVGKKGTITLSLCGSCINKFAQKEKVLESGVQPLSNTNQSIQPLSLQGVHQQDD